MDNKGSSFKGSFMLLQLLLPTLLLCSSTSSLPICPTGVFDCDLEIYDLFQRTVYLSAKIDDLSREMYIDINNRYDFDPDIVFSRFEPCHTSSIPTPENKEQARQMDEEVLLSLVLKVLRSWNDPLNHLAVEDYNVPKITNGIPAKAAKVKEGNKQIMEGLEMIIKKVDPEAKTDETYVAWSGISTLQTEVEDDRIYAFHNLLRCLRTDSHKVKTFLNFVMCQKVYKGEC